MLLDQPIHFSFDFDTFSFDYSETNHDNLWLITEVADYHVHCVEL